MSEEEAAMRAVFTSAIAGADEAENTYWFLFDDELTLIDTPGILEIGSIDNFISVDMLKKVTPKKIVKQSAPKKAQKNEEMRDIEVLN